MKIQVYIGKDRNTVLNELLIKNPLSYKVILNNDNNITDKERAQKLLTAIGGAIISGHNTIIVPNIERLFSHYATEYLYKKIKEKYPQEIDLVASTSLPWYCWGADELIYSGELTFEPYHLDRIRYGNVLDAIGTGLLEF